MSKQRKQDVIQTTLSPELRGEVDAELERTGETQSKFLRRAIVTTLKKKKLAETVQMGRPKKGDGK